MVALRFLVSMFLSFLPGLVGMMYSPRGDSDVWYSAISKSVLNPPGWVFPIVWNLLYVMLGVALFLVLSHGWKKSKKAFVLFYLHMVLNGLWSYVFFGLHWIWGGALIIIVLIAVAVWMQKEFLKINDMAGNLICPYLAWLYFALYLNSTIIFLN